ncbi:MAG: HD-GYP domain-containing protein (c-di-GMP phosphodiesterase class II) [Pseudohongiellaceae bacterium]|jgi:HD-GYP domain-containing protein (c-di-GMP phosphodiesterase class II)
MAVYQSDILEPKLTEELLVDINIHYQRCEKALLELDRTPNNEVLIQQLFRGVHAIRSALGVVGFAPLMPLLDSLEDVVFVLKNGRVEHSPLLGDLMLLMLDDARAFIEDFQRDGQVAYDAALIKQISDSIEQIIHVDNGERESLIAATIRLLDPAVAEVVNADINRIQTDSFLSSVDLDEQKDLTFFRDLMVPVEARSQFWAGRCDRILKMSLMLNNLAGEPVDEMNLAVAVYVHDFGMSFMPVELLHQETSISNGEMLLMRSHVQNSANLLNNMPRWYRAKEMVMQHHEAADGSGYPCGLREEQICDGAKILAVADTFDALTHQRAYSAHQKRPIIRAVKEVNDCAGKQLSPYWVRIFNQAVNTIFAAHQNKGY